MRRFKLWMFAAILLCGTVTMITSCSFNEDNPSSSSRAIPEGGDSKDYQPSDFSVALLGSLGSYADEEVVRYWFTDVQPMRLMKPISLLSPKCWSATVCCWLWILRRLM